MRIIVRTRLLAEPEPEFVGTKCRIRVSEDEGDWGIREVLLAEGRESVTIDWGDGKREVFTPTDDLLVPIYSLVHIYETAGEYEVRISDDVAGVMFSTNKLSSVVASRYAPRILTVSSNAERLSAFENLCFNNCQNLTGITWPSVERLTLGSGCFRKCAALPERFDIPGHVHFDTTATNAPFSDCPQIRELHFAADQRDEIEAFASALGEPTLGAANATLLFDL